MRRREFRIVYTVAEAAELLGIGRSTAYELVASGELPTVRIGRRAVVTRPTITALAGIEPPLPRELNRADNKQTGEPTEAPRRAKRRPARAVDQSALPFSI